jgi:hypothetical protein
MSCTFPYRRHKYGKSALKCFIISFTRFNFHNVAIWNFSAWGITTRSLNCVISIVTRLRAEWTRNCGSIPGRIKKFFPSAYNPGPLWDPNSFLFICYLMFPFLGVKATGSLSWLFTSSTDVSSKWSYFSTPAPAFSACTETDLPLYRIIMTKLPQCIVLMSAKITRPVAWPLRRQSPNTTFHKQIQAEFR